MSISVCILVRNEAELLGRCLESIHGHVDEIIVVDNGSTDHTQQVAKQYNSIIVYEPDTKLDGGRNKYIGIAKNSWILVLDADELITEESINIIKKTINSTNKTCMGFYLPRFEYIGQGKWAAIELLRVFRNDPNIQYNDRKIHASPAGSIKKNGGTIGKCNAPIHHMDILFKKRTIKKREIYMQFLNDEVTKTPTDYHLHYFIGLELAAIGRYEEAEEALCKSIQIDNNHSPVARLFLAQQFLAQCRYEDAKREASIMIENAMPLMDRAYAVLAEIAIRCNDKNLAKEYIEKALYLNPFAPHHHINMATLLEKEDPEKALNHIYHAIKQNPFLLNKKIYEEGEKPNIFEMQCSFLSTTKPIFEILDFCRNPSRESKIILGAD